MPIQLSEENGGKLLAVQVSGKLAKADYEHFVPSFGRLVQQNRKLRVLFDLNGFAGWDADSGLLWDDIKFNHKHSANLERLAILEEQRRDLSDCLGALWRETFEGTRRFKLYRQLKMYNDPALNPAVYRASAPAKLAGG